jgi:hypothetical protein
MKAAETLRCKENILQVLVCSVGIDFENLSRVASYLSMARLW